jgi:LmbE family N-acetylglucosaminyl deacetylase
LKVSNLERLGYADSGMVGWPTNDAPGSFWSTPVAVAAERLAELIRQYEPDVVVTYDEYGFYGHPDHIQAHRITMAALELTSSVAKTYWVTIPHSTMRKFERLFGENGAEIEPDRAPDGTEVSIGLPDDEVTTWVDIHPYVRAKFDALAAHASQGDNEFFLKAGLESFAEVFGVETFLRVHDNTDASLPEDDLFAGLR